MMINLTSAREGGAGNAGDRRLDTQMTLHQPPAIRPGGSNTATICKPRRTTQRASNTLLTSGSDVFNLGPKKCHFIPPFFPPFA